MPTAQTINFKNVNNNKEKMNLWRFFSSQMTSIWEFRSVNKNMTFMRLVIITRIKIKLWVSRTSKFITFFYIKYQTIFIAVIIPASFSTIFFLKHQLLSHFPHFQLFFLLNTNTIQVTKKTPLYPQYSEYPIAHKLFHLQVQMDLCLLVFLRPAMLTFSKRLLVMVQSLLACKIYYQ